VKVAARGRRRAAQRPRTQAERSTETTERLVLAAAEFFGKNGYARTSIDDIGDATGLTRGALYHHFAGKTDLFRAVFERKEAELVERIQAAARRHRDAWEAFSAGCVAFLEACLDPAVQRIILVDGPAVLGWDAVRQIESRHTLALIQRGLADSIAAGRLPARPIEPLSHLLLGALSECAKGIARASKPEATLKEAKAELARILAALAR
jgi:AcrR family transcriptional regulator